MNLISDDDIKIFGDKPLKGINTSFENQYSSAMLQDKDINNARELGKTVAERFIEDAEYISYTDESEDMEMILQRRILLSFTATVGFEQFCADDAVCGIAQKSFIDTVKKRDYKIYNTSSDTGAFSFYYLAYRRGGEIDRRIGQTFAMLCSHDGDPIYQELGEALYCWFLSIVKNAVKQLGLLLK